MSNYLFVFALSACDICNEQSNRAQIRDFDDFFKALIISRLNFIDTYFGPKIGLKKPKRDCKRAVVLHVTIQEIVTREEDQTFDCKSIQIDPKALAFLLWRLLMLTVVISLSVCLTKQGR